MSGEWVLPAHAAPPLAAHIITPRVGYRHHGIYVGDGKVVHYRGLYRGWRAGPVEEVSLEEFAHGRTVCIRAHADRRFDQQTVVARARSRLGEDAYRLLTNNCEHFSEWCVDGTHRSPQIEEWLALPRRVLLAAQRLLYRRDGAAAARGNTASVAA
jgi:cell wall-associated NlpC family hydrolase